MKVLKQLKFAKVVLVNVEVDLEVFVIIPMLALMPFLMINWIKL